MELKYYKTANKWCDATPVGNGKTGAMVYGGKYVERICFNDSSLWSGYPKNQDNAESLENLNKVRELIFDRKPKEAEKLVEEKLCGDYCESFLPLGEIYLKLSFFNGGQYIKTLDLNNSVLKIKRGKIKGETFCSYPDRVFIYSLKSPKHFNTTVFAHGNNKMESKVLKHKDSLNVCGNAPDYVAPNYVTKAELNGNGAIVYSENKGMAFCLNIKVVSDGKIKYLNNRIRIRNATQVVLYCVSETGFIDYDKMPINDVSTVLEKAYNNNTCKSLQLIKDEHIKDYRKIFDRQKLKLTSVAQIDAADLVKLSKNGTTKIELIQAYYEFVKYLTICGSRDIGNSLTLQGIWNKSVRPPWSSNYTTNINYQMNYWHVSNCNMKECFLPYIKTVENISSNGTSTAKTNYGCDGWCCNHNVDIWAKTAPVKGEPSYMFSPLSGAWLTNEIIAHAINFDDEELLEKAKTLLSGAAKFVIDYLVAYNNYYVICPSTSPENVYVYNGENCSVDFATAFDMGIVKRLLKNYLDFFGTSEYSEKVLEVYSKLYPFSYLDGELCEWSRDFEKLSKNHRHLSPLYSVFPGKYINCSNPIEMEKFFKLFKERVDNTPQIDAWSGAWIICLAGRFHKSEIAEKALNIMVGYSCRENLFNVMPPFLFQIEGNMGVCAGINQMLVYDENDFVELLPALPSSWKSGEMTGFLINGVILDFKWENNEIIFVQSNKPIKILNKKISKSAKLINVILKEGEDI